MQVPKLFHRPAKRPVVHSPQAHRTHLVLQPVYVEKVDVQGEDGRTDVDRRSHLEGSEKINQERGEKIMGDSCVGRVVSASIGPDGVQSGSHKVLRQFLLGAPS